MPVPATGTCHVSPSYLNPKAMTLLRPLFTWTGRRQAATGPRGQPRYRCVSLGPAVGATRTTDESHGPQPRAAAWLDATSPFIVRDCADGLTRARRTNPPSSWRYAGCPELSLNPSFPHPAFGMGGVGRQGPTPYRSIAEQAQRDLTMVADAGDWFLRLRCLMGAAVFNDCPMAWRAVFGPLFR